MCRSCRGEKSGVVVEGQRLEVYLWLCSLVSRGLERQEIAQYLPRIVSKQLAVDGICFEFLNRLQTTESAALCEGGLAQGNKTFERLVGKERMKLWNRKDRNASKWKSEVENCGGLGEQRPVRCFRGRDSVG